MELYRVIKHFIFSFVALSFGKMKPTMSTYKILKPIIYLSVIGGVCSIPINNKYRRCLTIFCSIIAVLNFLHFLATPYAIIYIEKESEVELNANHDPELRSQHFILKIINPLSVSAVTLCCRLSILLQLYKKNHVLLNCIEDVDNMLETRQHHLNRNSLTIKIFAVVTLLISWPFQIYSDVNLISGSQATLIQFTLFFINIYNNFSTACCELQFISISWLIFTRFQLVQESLKKIGEVLKRNPKQEEIKRSKLLLMNRVESVSRYSKNSSSKIFIIKECQHMLCEVCDGLNNAYNYQLFLTLSSLFINVLLNLYFAIFGGFTQPATRKIITQSLVHMINNIAWSCYYFLRFIFICGFAEILINQGNSTKVVVSSVMRQNLDPKIKDEVSTFNDFETSKQTVIMKL